MPSCDRPGRAGSPLARKGSRGLVHLDQAGEGLPLGVDHRPAQLAHQQPGRLVAAQPELQPQLPGRDAVLVRRHQPGGQEPGAQAEVAAVEHRPGGDRDLPLAGRALQGQPLAAQLPGLVVPAGRAAEPVGPALLEQPAGAGRVIGEPGLELGQRSRQLGHPSPSRVLRHATYSPTGARGMSHLSNCLVAERYWDQPRWGDRGVRGLPGGRALPLFPSGLATPARGPRATPGLPAARRPRSGPSGTARPRSRPCAGTSRSR